MSREPGGVPGHPGPGAAGKWGRRRRSEGPVAGSAQTANPGPSFLNALRSVLLSVPHAAFSLSGKRLCAPA